MATPRPSALRQASRGGWRSGGTACQRQFLKGKLMLKQKRYGLFKENLGIGIKQGIFNGLVEGILYRKPRSFQSLPSNTRLFCRFSLQPGGWGTGVVPSAYLTPQKPWWGNWRVSLFLSLFHCLGYWTQKRFGGFGNWRVSSLVSLDYYIINKERFLYSTVLIKIHFPRFSTFFCWIKLEIFQNARR